MSDSPYCGLWHCSILLPLHVVVHAASYFTVRRKGACHMCTAAACTHNLELEEGGEGVTDSRGVSIARPVVRHVVNRHSNISQQQFWTVDSVLRKNERR